MTLSYNIEDNDNFFTKEQLAWLIETDIPVNVIINSASEFDDRWLCTNDPLWNIRFSGRNISIDFNSTLFKDNLSFYQIKLIKIILIYYINENSPSTIDYISRHLVVFFKELKSINHDNILCFLKSATELNKNSWLFYSVLFLSRKLEAVGFFTSSNSYEDLEDKLLFIPRPKTGDFGVYKNIDNVLPSAVISLIENGLTEWATRYTPTLNSPKEKKELFTKIKELQVESQLLDCIILGLCFITGARPVQLSKIAVQDICIDAQSNLTTRFSVMIPYAKKRK